MTTDGRCCQRYVGPLVSDLANPEPEMDDFATELNIRLLDVLAMRRMSRILDVYVNGELSQLLADWHFSS